MRTHKRVFLINLVVLISISITSITLDLLGHINLTNDMFMANTIVIVSGGLMINMVVLEERLSYLEELENGR